MLKSAMMISLVLSMNACLAKSTQSSDTKSQASPRRMDNPLGRLCFEALRRGEVPDQCKGTASGIVTLKVVGGARLPQGGRPKTGKPVSMKIKIGRLVNEEEGTLELVAEAQSDAKGAFSIQLAPGEYYVMDVRAMSVTVLVKGSDPEAEPTSALESKKFSVSQRTTTELKVEFTAFAP